MDIIKVIRQMGYIFSLLVLILGFGLLYYETQEPFSSLFTAILAAILVLGSFTTVRWLLQVFLK